MGGNCSKCLMGEGAARPTQSSGGAFPSYDQPGLMTTIGSQVYIYKQDPSQSHVGVRMVWLPVDIRVGPVTDDVLIMGMPHAYSPTDNRGNFLYRPETDPDAFDAVNTLSVVQQVLWMYRRMLSKGKARTLHWLWGSRPIRVYPHAGRDFNAHYSRQEKALKFYFFYSNGRTIYSSQSWDIVAHETGHAVLDSLQPGWLTSQNAYTGALHEAFGDITAIFSVLDQLDMCELVVAYTKGNIQERSNFLAAVGEQFGHGTGKYYGIRNAAEDLSISQASEEVHELSKVFTGAVYDILVKIFLATLHLDAFQPAETLYRAGRHLLSVFLFSVLAAPRKNATFEDVAHLMIKKEPQQVFKGFIQEEFKRREVFDESARPRPYSAQYLADRTTQMCGTYRMCTAKFPCSANNDSHGIENNGHISTTNQEFPIDTASSVSQGTSMPQQDMTDIGNKGGSVNYSSAQHSKTHRQVDKGTFGQSNLHSKITYQHVDNSGVNHNKHLQPNQGYQYLSIKDSHSHRHVPKRHSSQSLPSGNRASLSCGNVQQHLASQEVSMHGYQGNQGRRPAGTSGQAHRSRTTVDDRVWENHSATYSDNVFESTEI